MRPTHLVVVALLLVACGGGKPAATDSFPAPFSGDSEVQTTSFTLTGGDYVVDWTAAYAGGR